MTEALSNVIAGLATPGRFLAFCDETDLTKEPTSTMVGDIRLHAAVVVPSDGYAAFASELAAALRTFGVSEFHAVDIVNNGKKSVWQHREKADRLAASATPFARPRVTSTTCIFPRSSTKPCSLSGLMRTSTPTTTSP